MSIDRIEYKKLTIECLSPVHITDESGAIYSYQLLFEPQAKRIYFLNERLWVEFLYTHNLLPGFEKLIAGSIKAESVFEWLKAAGITIADLKSIITDSAAVGVDQRTLQNKRALTEIIRTVHNVDGQPYIPGSSIKGALRNGILYCLLKRQEDVRNYAWNRVSKILYDWNVRDKRLELWRLAQNIEIDLLHKLLIPKTRLTSECIPKTNMITSIMKGLSISDSQSEENVRTLIVQKTDVVHEVKTGKFRENRMMLFRECMPPGTKQSFSITLDRPIFSSVGINSIQDIIAMQKEYFEDIIKMQASVFGDTLPEEFLKAHDGTLFIGGGTGFLSKTILAALAPDAESARRAIAMVLHNNFSKHQHLQLDKLASPRSVKIARTKRFSGFMGLCRIEV